MITTRLLIECDDCRNPFPAVGICPSPVDGAIYTPGMLRAEARADGWTRRNNPGGPHDLCPRCTKKAKKKASR